MRMMMIMAMMIMMSVMIMKMARKRMEICCFL